MTTASMPSKKPWHNQSHQFCENGKTMRKLDNDDDDDTQVYKRQWVELTNKELFEILEKANTRYQAVQMTEAKLKEKNT